MVARQAKIVPLPTPKPVLLENLLTIDEARKVLHVGREEMYRIIDEDGLPVVKLGGNRRRVKPSALAHYIDQREKSQGAQEEDIGT
jgi:excisionase family DNA binding protein